VYLAWLNLQMFFWGAGVLLFGVLVYKAIHDRTYRVIHAAREARARLFEHFRSLMTGLKELMLHRARREEFVQRELRETAETYRRTNMSATRRYVLSEAWVQTLLYGLIGLLLFAWPVLGEVPVETLTGYVLAILYVMSPLWTLIGALPVVMRGQVAFQRIEALGLSLDEAAAPATAAPAVSSDRAVIDIRAVTFTYEPAPGADGAFTLGPIDFTLRSGELIFVVGGNGSGKSTFAKVLTGLYLPDAGVMTNGGIPVTAANQEWHREHFSAVFSDFHLFDKLFGIPTADLQAATGRYLKLLQIDGKVQLRDRAFSTLELSQGQRKRLALVTAYLEDRPFYVFDEWAADQDPEYKNVFYSRLLPELRGRGKGVVVITHDDRYFHLGDRVLKLEEGRAADVTGDSRTGHADEHRAAGLRP
jgi:putative ATP-binding cassette transporter